MKMKALCALGATLAAATAANAAYTGLSYEAVADANWTANGFTGLTAWRIYANFSDPADMLIAVFGSPANPMTITSTDGLFHNDGTFDSLTAPVDYTGSPFFLWSNQWDTYVTIGTTDNAGDATGLTPNFAAEVGDLAGDFTTDNASWYITPVDPQGIAGADGRVLLAQFVVAEGQNVEGWISLQDGSGAQHLDQYFYTPAPGALALLGLAGLAGYRRRR